MSGALQAAQADTYDRTRDLRGKGFRSACYAPFVSMYFEANGHVTACCQNTTYVLGSVQEASLREIWEGPRAEAMRASLRGYDFGPGCAFCRWQVDDENPNVFASRFDGFPADDPGTVWPRQMEFALSNTCNLECVMCHGEFSSAIRARREHLPPLPSRYGDGFFAQLRPFLPHLLRARFFGGEPFLMRESYRVWDLMIDDGLEIACNVTTNGTVWNKKVERVLEHLPVSIGLSIDGVTAETVEAVRRGASYAGVMANLGRFREYTSERGTHLSLTFCLMRANWHEFGRYLALGDELGCQVFLNTVVYPPSLSLYRLPADELRQILDALRAEGETLRLVRNEAVWLDELSRLQHWVDRLDRRDQGFDDNVYFEDHVEDAAPPAVPLAAPARRA